MRFAPVVEPWLDSRKKKEGEKGWQDNVAWGPYARRRACTLLFSLPLRP
jgi:hypothetical protein